MKQFRLFLFFINLLILLWIQIGIVNAIVGGTEASINQFKYQISLQFENENSLLEHMCTGSIIGNLHVLTAAHCVIDNNNKFEEVVWTIAAGIINVHDSSSKRIQIKVQKIYVPREFEIDNSDISIKYHETADIAVLKLQRSLDLDDNTALKKLILPEMYDKMNDFLYEKAVFTGFGTQRHMNINDITANSYSTLKFVQTKIISNKAYSEQFHSPIRDKIICAKIQHENRRIPEGVCQGDSGGPLVLGDNIIIGVLARGPGNCNEDKAPGVYTKVTKYIDFIKLAMADEISEGIRVAIYTEKRERSLLSFKSEIVKVFMELT